MTPPFFAPHIKVAHRAQWGVTDHIWSGDTGELALSLNIF
jgi:hypothetical protein